MITRALVSLSLLLALGLFVGCYNPELTGKGGFLCKNKGPCPAGYTCVSEHCVLQGQPGPDARLDGPMPRPEARVDGRLDRPSVPEGPVMPDWPLPFEGPLPPPPTDGPPLPPPPCKLVPTSEVVITQNLAIGKLDDRFDFEVDGSRAAVLFRAQDSTTTSFKLVLARRSQPASAWTAGWLPIPTNHLPTGFLSLGLATPNCPGNKDVIVYQAQNQGVHYIADDGTSVVQPQGSVDAQTDVGEFVDVARAQPTGSIGPVQPTCASFWVVFSAGGIDGMRRALLDLGPPMVHWNQAVPTGPPNPQQQPASHITQHWDGNNHYFHYEAEDEVRVRVAQGNNTTPLDTSFSPVDPVKQVPAEIRSISAALDRFVFVGFDPTSSQPTVRYHDAKGIVSPIAPGRRPSLAINQAGNEEAITFIDTLGIGRLVVRKMGQPWNASNSIAINGVSRIVIRAAPNNEWEVVYARPNKTPPELVSARYACP